MTIATLLESAALRTMTLEQSHQTVHGSGMAAQTRLLELLRPLFPEGNVYPDTAHDARVFPDCVYSVNDTGSLQYSGVDVSRSVLFGLSLRDPVQADLVELFDELNQALHPQPGVEMIGYATGYDGDVSTETAGNFVIGVEVLINTPAGFIADDDQLYSILCLPGKEAGIEGRYDNCGTQSVLREHHAIYHASTQQELNDLRHDAQQAVHFKTLSDAERPIEFLRGQPLEAEGGLFAWVDVWRDRYRKIPVRNP